jgi:signal transduction histidine kinase
LKQVLREAQRQLSEVFKQTNATVTHDSLPEVHCDLQALASVFHSVFENSCKFCGEASPEIHVEAEATQADWIISIRDNGKGFDPRYRDLIFKPFERLEGKAFGGSGLGLARAKRLIEQHGGRIWADSKPGEGTTIFIALPLAD